MLSEVTDRLKAVDEQRSRLGRESRQWPDVVGSGHEAEDVALRALAAREALAPVKPLKAIPSLLPLVDLTAYRRFIDEVVERRDAKNRKRIEIEHETSERAARSCHPFARTLKSRAADRHYAAL